MISFDRDLLQKNSTYLLVLDKTQELTDSLEYLASYIKFYDAQIALLCVADPAQESGSGWFMPWFNVGERVNQARKVEAQDYLNSVAAKFQAHKIETKSHLADGSTIDAVKDIVEQDRTITNLLLISGENSNDPGPLVSYFTRKGLDEIGIPVTVLPYRMEY